MKNLKSITLALSVAYSSASLADTSLGPNPYQSGFGFDQPQQASWGGWQRGTAGTLYAEWDVFKDTSHGGATDRTAAPDLGKTHLTSAWLGWNTGTFISSTENLYSFSTPEVIQIDLAGTPASGATRLALQVETQGDGSLDAKYLRVNGSAPTAMTQTFKGTYSSPSGPADLIHKIAIWDFSQAPTKFVINFTLPVHTTVRQVAVDIGPNRGGSLGPSQPSAPVVKILERTNFILNLPAEDIGADLTTSLYSQKRKTFPQVWPDSQLKFSGILSEVNGKSRTTQRLSGSIKALYYDTKTNNQSNQIFIDFYHRDENSEIKIAECELKPSSVRWTKVRLDDKEQKLATARYKLNVASVTNEATPDSTRLTSKIGQCDTDLSQAGIQAGVPAVQDGDFTVIRRLTP